MLSKIYFFDIILYYIIFCAGVIVEIITKIQKKFTAIMNSLIS